ncbi:hypothetical protein LINPERHAP1_LOCUS33316, partial [Linum perenne]
TVVWVPTRKLIARLCQLFLTYSSLLRCTLDSTRATCHQGELFGLASVAMRPGRIGRMCLDPRFQNFGFVRLSYTILSYAYVNISLILCISMLC